MNSSMLDEKRDEEVAKIVAEELGLTVEDLNNGGQWELDEDTSSEGLVYGHIVTFLDGFDQKILNKIPDLIDNRWIKIAPIDLDRD